MATNKPSNWWVTELRFHGYVKLEDNWVLIGGCDRFANGDPDDSLTKMLAVWDDKPRRVQTADGTLVREWL